MLHRRREGGSISAGGTYMPPKNPHLKLRLRGGAQEPAGGRAKGSDDVTLPAPVEAAISALEKYGIVGLIVRPHPSHCILDGRGVGDEEDGTPHTTDVNKRIRLAFSLINVHVPARQ